MFFIFSAGIVLWLIYGVLLQSVPLIVSNAVTLLLSLTIIALKIRYREPRR
jgi:MtN3 and saliva related transmembrane protein